MGGGYASPFLVGPCFDKDPSLEPEERFYPSCIQTKLGTYLRQARRFNIRCQICIICTVKHRIDRTVKVSFRLRPKLTSFVWSHIELGYKTSNQRRYATKMKGSYA